ncbi:MAG TPA: hypothetical protein VGZ02_15995 [Candidatus Baltobacteraceae bacterium]|jgi:hypothetical protein|nr:hypothetical protein [Candidatus Baltobacteraceae bacterium]
MINDSLRLPIALGSVLQGSNGAPEQPGDIPSLAMPAATNDSVRRMAPPESSGFATPAPFGGFGGIVAQLLNIIAELMQTIGFSGCGGGSEPYFQTASASSVGDPHVAFNGTDRNGQNQSAAFTSMTSHADLLDSDSFTGGYRVETDVTAPQANGVTYNRSAGVELNYGATAVTLDNTGAATLSQDGRTTAIADGQSVDLGNGETVLRNADGSLVVTAQNASGGACTTTLSRNGQGVDVNIRAQNAGIGGYLVRALTAR